MSLWARVKLFGLGWSQLGFSRRSDQGHSHGDGGVPGEEAEAASPAEAQAQN